MCIEHCNIMFPEALSSAITKSITNAVARAGKEQACSPISQEFRPHERATGLRRPRSNLHPQKSDEDNPSLGRLESSPRTSFSRPGRRRVAGTCGTTAPRYRDPREVSSLLLSEAAWERGREGEGGGSKAAVGRGMIDAARLSGTWTAADSRSMGLITTTRNAHIIVIFIKHRAYIRSSVSRPWRRRQRSFERPLDFR